MALTGRCLFGFDRFWALFIKTKIKVLPKCMTWIWNT